jgi:hypothetical protein
MDFFLGVHPLGNPNTSTFVKEMNENKILRLKRKQRYFSRNETK